MRKMFAILVVMLIVVMPAMAGEKGKCAGSGEDCMKIFQFQSITWFKGVDVDERGHPATAMARSATPSISRAPTRWPIVASPTVAAPSSAGGAGLSRVCWGAMSNTIHPTPSRYSSGHACASLPRMINAEPLRLSAGAR